MDSKVSDLVDTHDASDEEDDLIASLESTDSDPTLTALREKRLEQLHSELNYARTLRQNDHGTYAEIQSEEALLNITTTTKLSVVHFSKSDFNRCRIMDVKLEQLAEVHYEARIVKMDVGNAPFLTQKLNVRVLPCVICFVDGKSVDRIVGFEGLGDGFSVQDLERRLVGCGVLVRSKVGEDRSKPRKEHIEEDNDDDWD